MSPHLADPWKSTVSLDNKPASSGFSEGSSPAAASSRRVSNLYNARLQYPYPDYFNYQAPQNMMAAAAAEQGARGTRIQIVPCMCPISVPSVVSAASPSAAAATAPPLAAITAPSSESQPAARHIERHSQELEADANSETENDLIFSILFHKLPALAPPRDPRQPPAPGCCQQWLLQGILASCRL
ncbi:uncharacterized protein [Drosophila kikkawai]|uniref:Uncharacterized protein isoform X2 n=1 Tax=Drosophila kikkawai TaxID=30033 RepID=A0A6P4HZE1_DROKI|nr:uncharacterized protein LOC108071083 isoform X2 [Drosophila kikkawai]